MDWNPTPASPQGQNPMLQPPSRMPLRWLIAIVVIAALLVGGVWYRNMHRAGGGAALKDATLTRASAGTVTSSFPKSLLPETGAVPQESYAIDYQSGVKLAEATYRSGKNLSENITMFRSALAMDGWSILRDPNPKAGVPASFYAKKGKAETTITFTDDAGAIKVTAAYTVHP
jgi:hypothetical protein